MPVANIEQSNVVAEAIALAIEGMSRLPDPHRSESNIAALQQVLRDLAPTKLTNLQSVARSSVHILLGIRPQARAILHDRLRCKSSRGVA